MTEDEMMGWHHLLYGHEFEQVLGVGDEQEGLECFSPCGHKELDMTKQRNNNKFHGRSGRHMEELSSQN